MVSHFPVGQHHAPHYFGEYHPLAQVEPVPNHSRERKVVDGLPPLRLGNLQESMNGGRIEIIVPAQGGLDVRLFLGREFAIRLGQLEEERAQAAS